MGGGDEGIGRGDDLTRDTEGLQGGNQRQGAIGKKADVGHLEILCECLFQALVIFAVVGYPLLLPDVLEEFVELVKIGQQGGGYGDGIIHFNETIYYETRGYEK